jgi:hypothetical protein
MDATEGHLVERFEALVRENEGLRRIAAHLELGVGHTSLLINLAKVVAKLRDEKVPVEEAHEQMFALVTEWEARRK